MQVSVIKYIFIFFSIFAFNLLSQEQSTNSVSALDEYTKAFKFGTPTQKLSAITKIKRSKKDDEFALLVEHYPNEANNRVKSEIIEVFKQVKNDNAKSIIEYAIVDDNNKVRQEAYLLCSIYPDVKFESNILMNISNESGAVLDSMIVALSAMKSTSASDYLLEKYTNNTVASSTKIEIIKYFTETKDSKGEDIIKKAAQNVGDSALLRYTGVVGLGAFPSAENYEIIQKLLEEDIPEITARVIYILPEYSAYGDVKKDIFEAAKNDNESVRIYAIKALKNYRAEAEDLLLYRLKNDNSQAIIMEILNLYDDTPPTGAMYDAIKELADNSANKRVQDRAKKVLGLDSSSNTEANSELKS